MTRLYARLAGLIHDRSGATAIQYGLIVALIAMAIMGAAVGLGSALDTTFQKTSDKLKAANNPGAQQVL